VTQLNLYGNPLSHSEGIATHEQYDRLLQVALARYFYRPDLIVIDGDTDTCERYWQAIQASLLKECLLVCITRDEEQRDILSQTLRKDCALNLIETPQGSLLLLFHYKLHVGEESRGTITQSTLYS
jgi:hypothetical protein